MKRLNWSLEVRRLDLNRRKHYANLRKMNLVAYTHPDSRIAEEYRSIRTNLHFITRNRKSRIFLVTSPSMGEGKTTAAANLAVSMAQQKENVLLIDGNLRNPTIHNIFKISNSSGLTDVISGSTTFEESVHQTKIGRLDVLTSGSIHPNPAELIGSQLMRDLFSKTFLSYDTVLIDSAPTLGVTDTALLASLCDGVVLVMTQGKTKLDKVAEAKKIFEFSKTEVLGVILNERF